jgi:N12 class adenine-specific DNA methylase
MPQTLVARDRYTSGDVVAKLAAAKSAAETDPSFAVNVAALEAALPQRLSFSEISINFGQPWIDCDWLDNFFYYALDAAVKSTYDRPTNLWNLDVRSARDTIKVTQEYGLMWGTYSSTGNFQQKMLTAFDLVKMALNLEVPTIKRRSEIDGQLLLDAALTAAARQKQTELRNLFRSFLEERYEEEVVTRYNSLFNNLRLTEWDGSGLTLPGMDTLWQERVMSRPYQLNGIYGALTCPYNFLLAWDTGLGKMIACITIAIKSRQINPAVNPIYVVQKSTIGDAVSLAQSAYPGIQILSPKDDDFSAENAPVFLAQMATGNYDLVIMSHEQFKRISLHPDTVKRMVDNLLAEVEADIAEAERALAVMNFGARKPKKSTRELKELERKKNRFLDLLERSEAARDLPIYMEDICTNPLFILDEAHCYKKTPCHTKLKQVAGLPSDHSDIALDLDMKLAWAMDTYGLKCCVMATATPINNSFIEILVILRRLYGWLPQAKRDMGNLHMDSISMLLEYADDFIAQFGVISQTAEVKPTGDLKSTVRLRDVQNVPELKAMLRYVADIRTAAEVGLPEPEMKTYVAKAEMHDAQVALIKDIQKRTENFQRNCPETWLAFDDKGNPVIDPETGKQKLKYDNYLLISTHGQWGALDYRLYDPLGIDHPKSKLNQAVRRIFRIWKATRTSDCVLVRRGIAVERATQAVFLDLGTDGGSQFNLYRDIRDKLVAMGMPKHEILFAQEAKTSEQTTLQHQKMRSGEASVFITSSSKGGIGVNIQDRLFAVHRIQPQWRPDIDKQGNGRMKRYGNKHKRVMLFRYLTTGVGGTISFDAFMLDHMTRKAKMCNSILSPDMRTRTYNESEDGNPAANYAALMAIATGDIRYIDLVNARTNLEVCDNSIISTRNELRSFQRDSGEFKQYQLRGAIADLDLVMQDVEPIQQALPHCSGDNFQVTILDEVYTGYAEAYVEAVRKLHEIRIQIAEEGPHGQAVEIGAYAGFRLIAYQQSSGSLFRLHLISPRIHNESHRSGNGIAIHGRYEVRLIQDVAKFVAEDRLKKALEEAFTERDRFQERIRTVQAEIDNSQRLIVDREARLHDLYSQRTILEEQVICLEKDLGVNAAEEAAKEIVVGDDV